jgi:mono/diheme cytochrome c family protein
MKQLWLISVVLLFFWSCSRENEERKQSKSTDRTAKNELKADIIRLTRGKLLFAKYCENCHTKTHEVTIGPGLAGITQRQSRDRIKKWIQNPSQLIVNKNGSYSKDEYAVKLFKEYNTVAMPSFHLSDKDIDALIDYIEQK